MAKAQQRIQGLPSHRQRRRQSQHHHHIICFSRSSTSLLCCITIAILILMMACGIASGGSSTNMNAKGNHNYTTTTMTHLSTQGEEKRLRRETEIQRKSSVVAAQTGIALAAGTDDDISSKTNRQLTDEAKHLERNFINPYKELNIYKRAPNGFIGMRGKKEKVHDDDESGGGFIGMRGKKERVHYDDSDDGDGNGNGYFRALQASSWYLDPLILQQNFEDYDQDQDWANDDDDNDERRIKKAPNAFYGVRGKKKAQSQSHNSGGALSPLKEMAQQLEAERLRARMLQDFIGRLAVATARQNEIDKRAPTGFTGLRGKRPAAASWAQVRQMNDENQLESHEKRAPVNAFVGVRGKKDVANQQEGDAHQTLFKRSPSEKHFYNFFAKSFNGKRRLAADFNNKFVAVRGKKAAALVTPDADIDGERRRREAEAEAEEQSQFLERQRLHYLVNLLPSPEVDVAARNVKRSSSFIADFGGMRGKRAALLRSDM